MSVNEHRPQGTTMVPVHAQVTLAPAWFGALVTEPGVKQEDSRERWAGISGPHMSLAGGEVFSTSTNHMGPVRWEGATSRLACLLGSMPSSLTSHTATSLDF